MVNMVTLWGNVLIYLEMPSWVKNLTDALVEDEGDAPDVLALKRFLKGSPEYRQKRLKVVPELVQAPYAIRLMAPKSTTGTTVHQEGLVSTVYHEADVTEAHPAPILEVTFDFMEQRTVRNMSSLVKRYLPTMSVDMALCIGAPDEDLDAAEKEPEAVLGMWRLDQLTMEDYPQLPDRLATDGCSLETVDAFRASLLVKEASRLNLSTEATRRRRRQ